MFRRVLVVLLLLSSCISTALMADTQKQAVLSAAVSSPVVFEMHNGLPDPNEVFRLVNNQRQKNNLSPLRPNAVLAAVVEARAADMASHNYYAHQDSNGLYFDDLLKERRFYTSFGCENLELSFSNNPTLYIEDWMSSAKGHRECLLDSRVTEAGYAVTALPQISNNGQGFTPYVIVAIHATAP